MLYEPTKDSEQISQHLQDNKRLVCCLCADWCDNCTDWQLAFKQLATKHQDHCFVWINTEEHPDLVTEVDLDTLPVLLVQDEHEVLFLGTIRPSQEIVSRLISLEEAVMEVDDPNIYNFLIEN